MDVALPDAIRDGTVVGPRMAVADLGLLADVPFVMKGGRVLKGGPSDAPLSATGPYLPA